MIMIHYLSIVSVCQSFRILSLRYRNSFTVLEWAPVRLLMKDKSTCSSRSMSLSEIEDQASPLNMRPLQSLVSLILRPICIWKQPEGISAIRPIISDTLPHPSFLLFMIVSWDPPFDMIMSPNYLALDATFMSLSWTFKEGHFSRQYLGFPMWRTQLLSSESVNLWFSIKEFKTAFFDTDCVPHSPIEIVSSTMPRTPIALFSLSIMVVHWMLPQTDPCIMTSFPSILFVSLLLILIAIWTFLFSR